MKLLLSEFREIIKETLLETNVRQGFEEWLSPEIVNYLIGKYAKSHGEYELKWEYSTNLRQNIWGSFEVSRLTLYVNKQQTHNLFKQQVETILHEIQHWNQFVDLAIKNKATNTIQAKYTFGSTYAAQKKYYGYRNCPMEVDARDFSRKHLEEAIDGIGKLYGGKIEGGSLNDAIEELMDDALENGEKLTRAQIGQTLKTFDLNTLDNMTNIIKQLKDLGIKII